MITTPLGRVERDTDGMRLEFIRTFDTDIDDVWSALTESDRLARWFGSWTGDPTSGQVDVVMTAEGDTTPQRVTIIECDAPNQLIVEVPGPDGVWRLSVVLSARDGATTMVFTHRLAEPYDASSVGPGWHFYLDRLDAVVAGRSVSTAFDPYMEELSTAYPVPD